MHMKKFRTRGFLYRPWLHLIVGYFKTLMFYYFLLSLAIAKSSTKSRKRKIIICHLRFMHLSHISGLEYSLPNLSMNSRVTNSVMLLKFVICGQQWSKMDFAISDFRIIAKNMSNPLSVPQSWHMDSQDSPYVSGYLIFNVPVRTLYFEWNYCI